MVAIHAQNFFRKCLPKSPVVLGCTPDGRKQRRQREKLTISFLHAALKDAVVVGRAECF
jgi:hypothetical protein